MQSPSYDFIIPVYNEHATIAVLFHKIEKVMSQNKWQSFRVIYIDDGSRDDSWSKVLELNAQYPERVQGIRLRRNFGKAEALQAGFSECTGDIVFTMDADLQDDPEEIPAFIDKIHEGFDMVSGWKKIRHDPIDKTLPSKVFNALARMVSGVKLHDFNCGFKAYRKEVTEHIELFGELHRFIPILADAEGFSVGEIPVRHHPREHGISKYGSKRFIKGLLDLITVVVIARYLKRPAHVFGGAGLACGLTGFAILGWLSFSKLAFQAEIGGRPLFFLGILLLLLGTQLGSMGLIAEMMTRLRVPATEKHIAERAGL